MNYLHFSKQCQCFLWKTFQLTKLAKMMKSSVRLTTHHGIVESCSNLAVAAGAESLHDKTERRSHLSHVFTSPAGISSLGSLYFVFCLQPQALTASLYVSVVECRSVHLPLILDENEM